MRMLITLSGDNMDMNNRNTYITFTSGFGNDPLTDKLIGYIPKLTSVETYRIPSYNEFRPDKIAAKFFGDSNLYWVVLEYNKLASAYELFAGRTIKIPSPQGLSQLLVSVNTDVSTIRTYFIK